jgi:hypothetical protein
LTSVGSIRADVSRRPLIFAALLVVVAAACSDLPEAEVDFGSGQRFVPYVVDGIDDVGHAPSVATNADGQPFIASLGFPQELAEGEVAPVRPIGSPFLPAVLLATVSSDGQWDRGAVMQAKPASGEPQGVGVSFGPETVDGLEMSAESTNGTAVAVAPDGTVHVAWTAPDGVWYASTKQGGPTSVEQVFDYGSALKVAGPIGRPGIAVDGNGAPWVAYAVNASGSVAVRVATPAGDGWDDQLAIKAGSCNGCPQPGPAGIVVAGDTPTVGFVDPATSQLRIASLDGTRWSESSVDAGEGARGLSMAVDGDAPVAAFYAGGSVKAMAADGSVSDVAEADPEGPDTGTLAPTTGIASDGNGTLYVTWQDAGGVHLASGAAGSLTEVETPSTQAGASPAVAVGSNGAAYLAWYDTTEGNLEAGILGEPEDIIVARPSPSITVSIGPAPSAGCGEDGAIALDIVAKGTAWDTNCLVAPAGEPFTINIDNQDAGIPHNLDLFDQAGGTSLAATELQAGPVKQTLDVDPLDAGEYYFQCDAHPTTMTGTLVAIEGGKTK